MAKRGYSSKNGIASAILKDNGLVLDFAVLTKKLQSMQILGKEKKTSEHEQLLLEHDCPTNHEKSSGSMESSGTLQIFN